MYVHVLAAQKRCNTFVQIMPRFQKKKKNWLFLMLFIHETLNTTAIIASESYINL